MTDQLDLQTTIEHRQVEVFSLTVHGQHPPVQRLIVEVPQGIEVEVQTTTDPPPPPPRGLVRLTFVGRLVP